MDGYLSVMHFNHDSIVMIIINTLREMHLYRNFSPLHNRQLSSAESPSSCIPDALLRLLFPPPAPRPPHTHNVLFAQDASATLCVPLLSNLINVPVQRETEGLRFVAGRMAIRFSLTCNPSLFSIVALVVSPECSICTYFELNVSPQCPPR